MVVQLFAPFCYQAKSLKPDKEEVSVHGLPFYYILERDFSLCSVVFIRPGSEAVSTMTTDYCLQVFLLIHLFLSFSSSPLLGGYFLVKETLTLLT